MNDTTSNETLEAILPLLARDHGRFALLRLSLDRFWKGGTIHVIVRPEDMGCTRGALGEDQRFCIVNQDSLMGGITRYAPGVGWRAQQILKLAASQIVGSDFYLTLDADCLLVRSVSREALVRNERGRVDYNNPNHRADWYQESSRMLGLPRTVPARDVSVTPFLLHTETAAALTKHTADLARERKAASWQQMLLHDELKSSRLIGPSVWFKQDAEAWDPSKAFEGERDFFFVVVQSNTHIDAEWTRARVTPYLL